MKAMPLGAIVGHAPIVALLRQAVARGRVPQSLLFAGPEGVGKHAVAIALAQAVNCPVRRGAKDASKKRDADQASLKRDADQASLKRDADQASLKRDADKASLNDDACGTCPTCERIARGAHTDVVVLDRGDDATIKLKYLRERVLDLIGYRPFEAARRVFIIAADDLQDAGQDALLKTLEEPPPSAMLILISAFPDSLSQTVQSRCRRLRFGPLSEKDVARILVAHSKVERAAAGALAAASGGSVARALAEKEGDLGDDRDAAFGVLRAAGRNVADQLKASAALAKHDSDRRDREALAMRVDVIRSFLRDLGAMAARRPDVVQNADVADELRTLSSRFDLTRVTRGYETLARAESALERNASPKIVADWIALQL
jgi:DNA polymerase-3 subunit delta'